MATPTPMSTTTYSASSSRSFAISLTMRSARAADGGSSKPECKKPQTRGTASCTMASSVSAAAVAAHAHGAAACQRTSACACPGTVCRFAPPGPRRPTRPCGRWSRSRAPRFAASTVLPTPPRAPPTASTRNGRPEAALTRALCRARRSSSRRQLRRRSCSASAVGMRSSVGLGLGEQLELGVFGASCPVLFGRASGRVPRTCSALSTKRARA